MVTPSGVVAAVYLREYAKKGLVTRVIRSAVNNLAGVPSMVFGMFGLGFFVYFLGGSIDQLLDQLAIARRDEVLINRNAQHGQFTADDDSHKIRPGTAFRPQFADSFFGRRHLALDLTGLLHDVRKVLQSTKHSCSSFNV